MKYRNLPSSAILLALLVCFCVRPARSESISVPEYRRQLHDIAEKVDALKDNPSEAGKLVTEIPDHVAVTTGSGEVSVNYKNLKDDLAAFSRADETKREALLPAIQKYVQSLNAAAETYEKPGADASMARGKLNEILSRHEFNKVKGPTAKDALLARIYRWLSRLLNKLSLRGGSSFDWMQLFIYLLVGAAASLLAIWTVRPILRNMARGNQIVRARRASICAWSARARVSILCWLP